MGKSWKQQHMKAEGKRERAQMSPQRGRWGEEPTGERGSPEPVEGRVPETLQPGVVRCPPPPPESRQEEASGEGRRGEGRTPGKAGTMPTAQGQMDTGHTENARDKALNKTQQNKNKEKNQD